MKIRIDKTFITLILLTISLFIVGIKVAIGNPNDPSLLFVGIYLIVSAAINATFTLLYFKHLNS